MRALVIGYGRMGRFHRRVLTDLGYDVSTVDPDPAAGADHIFVPRGRFDAVCVSTPIERLAEQAAPWAGATDRLLVEKNFAATVDEAVALRAALIDQPTCVGYVERFNPAVRHLKAELERTGPATRGVFVRWNDRPSPDVRADLTSHDIDLARYLDVPHRTFDSRAGQPRKRREITVWNGEKRTVDLLAHDTSPLHAQWHTFLSGRPGYATPDDAVETLLDLDSRIMAAA